LYGCKKYHHGHIGEHMPLGLHEAYVLASGGLALLVLKKETKKGGKWKPPIPRMHMHVGAIIKPIFIIHRTQNTNTPK